MTNTRRQEEIRLRIASDRRSGLSHALAHYAEVYPGEDAAVARAFAEVEEEDGVQEAGMIGPYRPVEELGRGGQGVVYLAEDTRLKRRVALKLLTYLGPGSETTVQRFKREAEVAGRLNHPGICGVHDAGVANGVPYIAMQYVEGRSLARVIADRRERSDPGHLDSWCIGPDSLTEDLPEGLGSAVTRSAATTTTRRELGEILSIFERAARALHAAHEAGVIHRDIKPGNVMLTPSGDPVILDFGLARSEDEDLRTLTLSGELFGTPAYMSPEQLLRGEVQLDRRTDVYSLAASLYECLTLQRPFQAATREALFQAVLTEDPTNVCKIDPKLPPELGVVLETGLEKDRDRRYATALDLAEELRRVRVYQPIHARAAGRWLRIRRWAQRHPGLALGLAIAFVSLAAGLATSITLLVQARAAQRVAEHEREEKGLEAARADREARLALEREQLARRQSAIATAVNEFWNDDVLGAVRPSTSAGKGKDVLMRDALDVAARALDLAAAEGGRFADKPVIEHAIRLNVGGVYQSLGLWAEAEPHLRRALALAESTAEIDATATLRTAEHLGFLLFQRGETTEAEAVFREALGSELARLASPSEIISLKQRLADLLRSQRRLAEAGPLIEELVATMRRKPEESGIVDALEMLAGLRANQERRTEAIALYEEARERAQGFPERGVQSRFVALNNLANLYLETGLHAKAAEIHRALLDEAVTVFGERHNITVSISQNLANALWPLGHDDEALALYERILETRNETIGADHPRTLRTLANMAALSLERRRYEEAEPALRKLLRRRTEKLGPDHVDTVRVRFDLGRLCSQTRRLEEAEQWLRDALGALEKIYADPGNPSVLSAAEELGRVLARQGRTDEARVLLEPMIARRRQRADQETAAAQSLDACARSLLHCPIEELRDPAAALRYAHRAVRASERSNPSHLATLYAALMATGDAERAESTLGEALALLPEGSPMREHLADSP